MPVSWLVLRPDQKANEEQVDDDEGWQGTICHVHVGRDGCYEVRQHCIARKALAIPDQWPHLWILPYRLLELVPSHTHSCPSQEEQAMHRGWQRPAAMTPRRISQHPIQGCVPTRATRAWAIWAHALRWSAESGPREAHMYQQGSIPASLSRTRSSWGSQAQAQR